MKKLKYLLFIPALILAFIFPINTLYAQSINELPVQTSITEREFGSDWSLLQYNFTKLSGYPTTYDYIQATMDGTTLYDEMENLGITKTTIQFNSPVSILRTDNLEINNISLVNTYDNIYKIEFEILGVGDYIVNLIGDITYSFDAPNVPEFRDYLWVNTSTFIPPSNYDNGWQDAMVVYGKYYNGQWITADDYAFILENDAKNEGIDQGYNEAKGDYGIYYEGEWLTAEQYAVIKVNEKVNELGNLELSIVDFVPGVLGAIFSFFFTLSSMSILGISILDILILVFGVGAVIFVIKLFVK